MLTYTMPTLTTCAAGNIRAFRIANPTFNGKIKAADQRKLFNGAEPFGRKSVDLRTPGTVTIWNVCDYRGEEISEVRVSETGRVFSRSQAWWNGKRVPEVGEYLWQVEG